MNIDQYSPPPTFDADHYVSMIEADLSDDSGCSSHLSRELDLQSQLTQLGAGYAMADAVFEKLKDHGDLPKLVRFIGSIGDPKDQAQLLDRIASTWGGDNAAEISLEIERVLGSRGKKEIVALSDSMARLEEIAKRDVTVKLDPTAAREEFVDTLAPHMRSQTQPNGSSSSNHQADQQSLAVARVWGSFKKDPSGAFGRMGERINVGAAVTASIDEVKETRWFEAGSISRDRIRYDTSTLGNLLEGAKHSGLPIKEKVLAEATAAIDRIKHAPLISRDEKEAAWGAVTKQFYPLRADVEARLGGQGALRFKTDALAADLRQALSSSPKKDGPPVVGNAVDNVLMALGTKKTAEASRGLAMLSDADMKRLADALAPELQLASQQPGAGKLTSIVERMDGTQINRLIDALLQGQSATSEQGIKARLAVSGLVDVVSRFTIDESDKVEVLQRLVPESSSGVATLLASLSHKPHAFSLAMRSIPTGEPLKAVLTAAMNQDAQARDGRTSASYHPSILSDIIEGAAHTRRIDYKRQIVSDVQALMKKIDASVDALRSGDPSAGAKGSQRDQDAARMAERLERQLAQVQESLSTLQATME